MRKVLGDHGGGQGEGKPRAVTDPALKNGIVGDGRKSSAKLGKRVFDLKVEYAVKQIQGFIPPAN